MIRHLFILLLASTLSAEPGYYEPWGKDAGLHFPEPEKEARTSSIATQIADRVIRFHQEVISPIDGPRSHFRPSSSRYMQLAMQRYGFFLGFLMGCDRLLRENEEEWVYRTVQADGRIFKYDPALRDKYAPPYN